MDGRARRAADRNMVALWAIAALVAFAVGALLFGLASHGSGDGGLRGYGSMMGGSGSWGWMWIPGALMMVFPIALLLLVFVWMARTSHDYVPASEGLGTDPVREVKVRLARGEITSAQYHQLMNELGDPK